MTFWDRGDFLRSRSTFRRAFVIFSLELFFIFSKAFLWARLFLSIVEAFFQNWGKLFSVFTLFDSDLIFSRSRGCFLPSSSHFYSFHQDQDFFHLRPFFDQPLYQARDQPFTLSKDQAQTTLFYQNQYHSLFINPTPPPKIPRKAQNQPFFTQKSHSQKRSRKNTPNPTPY